MSPFVFINLNTKDRGFLDVAVVGIVNHYVSGKG